MSGDFDFEPVPGLPELLPADEAMIWQGAPTWRALARDAFHVRKVAIYFGLLIAWSIASAMYDGRQDLAISGALWVGAFGIFAVAILLALSWATAATTVYTITSKRIVIRYGIALPLTVNLPFRLIGSAGLKSNADGTGDIPLALSGRERIAWLVMWPHVRPWRLSNAEPMLRGIPDAERVAGLLGTALAAAQRHGFEVIRSAPADHGADMPSMTTMSATPRSAA